MKKSLIFIMIAIIGMSVACTNKNKVNENSTATESALPSKVSLPLTGMDPKNVILAATAFRMSGDYANNVAVTLSPSGQLLYFPAPSDITADSEPIELGEGWWLNRQGIGPNSVFTKYTFAEYASLPETPSAEQLKQSIIPGAKVTQFIELPVNINEASENIGQLKEYVKCQ